MKFSSNNYFIGIAFVFIGLISFVAGSRFASSHYKKQIDEANASVAVTHKAMILLNQSDCLLALSSNRTDERKKVENNVIKTLIGIGQSYDFYLENIKVDDARGRTIATSIDIIRKYFDDRSSTGLKDILERYEVRNAFKLGDQLNKEALTN